MVRYSETDYTKSKDWKKLTMTQTIMLNNYSIFYFLKQKLIDTLSTNTPKYVALTEAL